MGVVMTKAPRADILELQDMVADMQIRIAALGQEMIELRDDAQAYKDGGYHGTLEQWRVRAYAAEERARELEGRIANALA